MKEYKPNLMNALKTGNKADISVALRDYKQPNGTIYFPALFEIPTKNRLPQMASESFGETLGIVTAAMTLAFESMNLVRGMIPAQIVDLSETILDSCGEDNLALEDLMLFLQKLTRGEYGKLYESMDIPKFMEMFEVYREERFQAIKTLRDEQHIQSKAMPINDRLVDMYGGSERDKQREALRDYLITKK